MVGVTNQNEALNLAAGLCRQFEGLRLKPYLCPAGIPTIGYGSTRYADGRAVTLQDRPITAAQAEDLLLLTLRRDYLAGVLKVSPGLIDRPKALAAALDFAYNLGVRSYADSTLCKRINAQDWAGARAELTEVKITVHHSDRPIGGGRLPAALRQGLSRLPDHRGRVGGQPLECALQSLRGTVCRQPPGVGAGVQHRQQFPGRRPRQSAGVATHDVHPRPAGHPPPAGRGVDGCAQRGEQRAGPGAQTRSRAQPGGKFNGVGAGAVDLHHDVAVDDDVGARGGAHLRSRRAGAGSARWPGRPGARSRRAPDRRNRSAAPCGGRG